MSRGGDGMAWHGIGRPLPRVAIIFKIFSFKCLPGSQVRKWPKAKMEMATRGGKEESIDGKTRSVS
jgi:hypothetical protein